MEVALATIQANKLAKNRGRELFDHASEPFVRKRVRIVERESEEVKVSETWKPDNGAGRCLQATHSGWRRSLQSGSCCHNG